MNLAILATLGLLAGTPQAAPAAGASRAPTADAYGPEPAATPTPPEAAALELARARLALHGPYPQVSGALMAAARFLAQEAAAGGAPAGRRALRNALVRALAYDPAPMAYTVRASEGRWREALARALAGGSATHVGAAVAEVGGERVIVVLASRRGARLDPFPRSVPLGERATLSGQLRSGLCNPRVFVSLPSGEVRTVEARGSVWFRAAVPFDEPGRHLVEVLADGPQGPTVAALLAVAAGGASPEEPPGAGSGERPADPARAEADVIEAVAALRARRGLAPLQPDAALSAVARRHAEAMRAAGTVAHSLPGEPGLAARLGGARIAFRRVYENVAAASTALEAHGAAEESPAHLRNLLEPGARRLGVGIAGEAAGDGRVYLTEILVE